MLVQASGIARNDPRDLRQCAMLEVIEVVANGPERALVVRVALPEDEDVVAIPERDAVPGVVVDLPADAGGVEQIEDDRVVEDPVPPEAVGRDPPRGSGREIEPVWPRRTEEGAEVFPAERELVEETVIKLGLGLPNLVLQPRSQKGLTSTVSFR